MVERRLEPNTHWQEVIIFACVTKQWLCSTDCILCMCANNSHKKISATNLALELSVASMLSKFLHTQLITASIASAEVCNANTEDWRARGGGGGEMLLWTRSLKLLGLDGGVKTCSQLA